MKVFNQENGFLIYQKIFSHLQANNCPLVVWQFDPSIEKRFINESKVNSYNLETKLIHLSLGQSSEFKSSLPLYCYSEEGQVIFKTEITELRGSSFSLIVPQEIKVLDDSERDQLKSQIGIDLNRDYMKVKRLNLGVSGPHLGGYMKLKTMSQRSHRDQDFLKEELGILSVDEEDKLFASQRETPRARPKIEKWVTLKLSDSENLYNLKLFDLSQGGMAFISLDAKIFPKGSVVYLMGIDAHQLDDPLVGKVMSQRPIDEFEVEWKIGVKFEDGQN